MRPWLFTSIYTAKTKDRNIWTPENLKSIKAYEDKIRIEDGEEWQKFCYSTSVDDPSCHPTESFLSPLSLFLASGIAIETITQEQINAVI